MKLYHWDGKQLEPVWTVDFIAEKLGRPHQMRFGARALYASEGTPEWITEVAER